MIHWEDICERYQDNYTLEDVENEDYMNGVLKGKATRKNHVCLIILKYQNCRSKLLHSVWTG
jgi:hypothetical protein